MNALDMLAGLARTERAAGAGDTAARVFTSVFLGLAWEAEVARLGLPYRGYGWAATPVGTEDQIMQAINDTEEP